MAKDDVIELTGTVTECYPNAMFRVRVPASVAQTKEDLYLNCSLAGRMRLNKVRILPGDRVKLEMSIYDLQKGRIVYRLRVDDPITPPTPPAAPAAAAPTATPPNPSTPAS